MPEPLGLAGDKTPGSCNGLFSAGFPTGVQGLSPHLTQRTSINQLPNSLMGQALRPPGGSTATYCANCNSLRLAHTTLYCKCCPEARPRCRFASHCNFSRLAANRLKCKLCGLWKAASCCGKP